MLNLHAHICIDINIYLYINAYVCWCIYMYAFYLDCPLPKAATTIMKCSFGSKPMSFPISHSLSDINPEYLSCIQRQILLLMYINISFITYTSLHNINIHLFLQQKKEARWLDKQQHSFNNIYEINVERNHMNRGLYTVTNIR